jgi:hypothetical protein
MLAGQLPETSADAALVLQATRQLVDTFLTLAEATTGAPAANVVAFRAGHVIRK